MRKSKRNIKDIGRSYTDSNNIAYLLSNAVGLVVLEGLPLLCFYVFGYWFILFFPAA